MRKAERLWVQFRDANCDYYINIPGTRANYIYAECRRVLTAQRAIELEAAVRRSTDGEGSMGEVPEVRIAALEAGHRDAWEPLWRGYQAF